MCVSLYLCQALILSYCVSMIYCYDTFLTKRNFNVSYSENNGRQLRSLIKKRSSDRNIWDWKFVKGKDNNQDYILDVTDFMNKFPIFKELEKSIDEKTLENVNYCLESNAYIRNKIHVYLNGLSENSQLHVIFVLIRLLDSVEDGFMIHPIKLAPNNDTLKNQFRMFLNSLSQNSEDILRLYCFGLDLEYQSDILKKLITLKNHKLDATHLIDLEPATIHDIVAKYEDVNATNNGCGSTATGDQPENYEVSIAKIFPNNRRQQEQAKKFNEKLVPESKIFLHSLVDAPEAFAYFINQSESALDDPHATIRLDNESVMETVKKFKEKQEIGEPTKRFSEAVDTLLNKFAVPSQKIVFLYISELNSQEQEDLLHFLIRINGVTLTEQQSDVQLDIESRDLKREIKLYQKQALHIPTNLIRMLVNCFSESTKKTLTFYLNSLNTEEQIELIYELIRLCGGINLDQKIEPDPEVLKNFLKKYKISIDINKIYPQNTTLQENVKKYLSVLSNNSRDLIDVHLGYRDPNQQGQILLYLFNLMQASISKYGETIELDIETLNRAIQECQTSKLRQPKGNDKDKQRFNSIPNAEMTTESTSQKNLNEAKGTSDKIQSNIYHQFFLLAFLALML